MLPNPVPPLPLASGESAASRGCSSAPACDPSQAHLAVEASLDGDPRSAVPTSPTTTPVTAEALCGVGLGKKSLTDTNSPLLNPPHEPTQPHRRACGGYQPRYRSRGTRPVCNSPSLSRLSWVPRHTSAVYTVMVMPVRSCPHIVSLNIQKR